MALSFTRLSWLWLSGKTKDQVSNESSSINPINPLGECGLGLRAEPESVKFYSIPNRKKAKRKWKSREERIKRIDKEHDVVLVPSDGVCLSGSESDDSDWSIGWLERHAPGFQCDDAVDDSFAVLVPCYRHDCDEFEENENGDGVEFMRGVKKVSNGYSYGGREYMERWLSSLQNF